MTCQRVRGRDQKRTQISYIQGKTPNQISIVLGNGAFRSACFTEYLQSKAAYLSASTSFTPRRLTEVLLLSATWHPILHETQQTTPDHLLRLL